MEMRKVPSGLEWLSHTCLSGGVASFSVSFYIGLSESLSMVK